MCIRWTLEGSSCGSSGWRLAGAVVKGVGMALELVLTAAAGLAKDFAARLLIAIVWAVDASMKLCGCGGERMIWLWRKRKIESGIALRTYREIPTR